MVTSFAGPLNAGRQDNGRDAGDFVVNKGDLASLLLPANLSSSSSSPPAHYSSRFVESENSAFPLPRDESRDNRRQSTGAGRITFVKHHRVSRSFDLLLVMIGKVFQSKIKQQQQ